MEKTKRLEEIDILKGIGIILVVLGHCISGVWDTQFYSSNWIFKFCYSFHMPLFMTISGFLSGLKTSSKIDGSWIKRKFKRLMIPYIIWVIIKAILANGFNFNSYFVWLVSDLHIWYLIVLFICDLSLFVYIKANSCVIIPSFYLANVILYVLFPNEICKNIIMFYPFYILGILISKYRARLIENKVFNAFKYSVVFIYPLCMIFYTYGEEQANYMMHRLFIGLNESSVVFKIGQAGLVFYSRYIVPLFGMWFVYLLVKVAVTKSRIISNIFSEIGKLTMPIYLMHSMCQVTFFDNILLNTVFSFILGLLIPVGFYCLTKKLSKLQSILFGM